MPPQLPGQIPQLVPMPQNTQMPGNNGGMPMGFMMLGQ
jgi:hypothetical protein